MSQKIVINSVSGGKDKSELSGCYFLPTTTPGIYTFYSKNNQPLMNNIFNHCTFSFILPGDTYNWTVPNPAPGSEPFSINNETASGSWFNTDPSLANEEGGTFTAQASGGVDEDEESASSATA